MFFSFLDAKYESVFQIALRYIFEKFAIKVAKKSCSYILLYYINMICMICIYYTIYKYIWRAGEFIAKLNCWDFQKDFFSVNCGT